MMQRFLNLGLLAIWSLSLGSLSAPQAATPNGQGAPTGQRDSQVKELKIPVGGETMLTFDYCASCGLSLNVIDGELTDKVALFRVPRKSATGTATLSMLAARDVATDQVIWEREKPTGHGVVLLSKEASGFGVIYDMVFTQIMSQQPAGSQGMPMTGGNKKVMVKIKGLKEGTTMAHVIIHQQFKVPGTGSIPVSELPSNPDVTMTSYTIVVSPGQGTEAEQVPIQTEQPVAEPPAGPVPVANA